MKLLVYILIMIPSVLLSQDQKKDSLSLKFYIEQIDIRIPYYTMDTTIFFNGEYMRLAGYRNGNDVFLAYPNKDGYYYLDGYIILRGDWMIRIVSKQFLKNITKIIVFRNMKIVGTLSLKNEELVGVSSFEEVNSQIIEESFVHVDEGSMILDKCSLGELLTEDYFKRYVQNKKNSGLNSFYKRRLDINYMWRVYGFDW